MNLFIEQTQANRHKTNLWLPKVKGERRINEEYEINIYTLPYLKQKSNKDLLYSTGNYIQYLVITYNGKII